MSRIRTRRPLRAVLLVAAFAALASTSAVLPADAVETSAHLDRWQRFRTSYGLRDDRVFAGTVAARSASDDVNVDYGTPLTRAEAALLHARDAQAKAQHDVVRSYLSRQPPDLDGGMYFDHPSGGRMIVLVTSDAEKVRQDLAGAKLDVRTVRYSWRHLRGLQDALIAANTRYRADGIEITSTHLDVEENRVVVRVTTDVTAATERLIRDFPGEPLMALHGSYAVSQGTTLKNSPPFKAGQAIGPGSQLWCSIGFIAQINDYWYFVVTAGHCGGVGSAWYQPCCAGYGAGLGVMDMNPYAAHQGVTDSARIPIPDSRKSNLLTRTMPGGGIYYYAITTWEPQGGDFKGKTDCNGGYATNWDCGQITETSADFTLENGLYAPYMRQSDTSNGGGDSGGPHFWVPEAHGIHYGRDLDTGDSIYSHIYDVLTDLSLSGLYVG
jgi:hypothetical protein